jgi:hypothetical protein
MGPEATLVGCANLALPPALDVYRLGRWEDWGANREIRVPWGMGLEMVQIYKDGGDGRDGCFTGNAGWRWER